MRKAIIAGNWKMNKTPAEAVFSPYFLTAHYHYSVHIKRYADALSARNDGFTFSAAGNIRGANSR